MNHIRSILLAAAAIGAVSIGSASAMPFTTLSPALAAGDVQNVRLVCDQRGRCYNTARYRTAPRYYAPSARYYNDGPQYYAAPQYRHQYRSQPLVGVGVGPFGLHAF
jgi:hypothetical protein